MEDRRVFNFHPKSGLNQGEKVALSEEDQQQHNWYITSNENSTQFLATPFEILKDYVKKPNNEQEETLANPTDQIPLGERKLSTVEVMRVAAERYIQEFEFPSSMHPYSGDLLNLSIEESREVELAQLLLSAAEKVGSQQFEKANQLLSHCELMAFDTGTPLERVVYYFSVALREKLDKQSGIYGTSFKRPTDNKKIKNEKSLVQGGTRLELLAFHQRLPFMQATQFAGMQAIVERVISAKRVHLIDLHLRSGTHWTILLQALAERVDNPVELIQLSAFGTQNKQDLEGSCKRLASFAESLNLPFSFNVVFVSDMNEIREEELFKVEEDEVIAVYSVSGLMEILKDPYHLESLMKSIRRIKPEIMVVNEVESNSNSPSFVKRFTESLFYLSAYFDCFEAFMERDDKYRMILEGEYFGEGVKNIVAAEGNKRINRSVKLDVWRAFLARFGMKETELSESSLYQARMVVSMFKCEESCNLDTNGKSLIIGWKGTPLHSLSVWNFT